MSSPFSKSFLNKRSGLFMTDKQESTFGEDGTNPNEKIYEGIKAADKAKGSPAEKHGEGKLKKAKRLSEKGGQGQGGYDYENEKVVELVKKGNALNASHTDSKKQEDAVVQDDMDASQESSINMNAPLKKKLVKENIPSGLNMNSPLNAYVDGSENKAQDLTGVMKDYFSSVKSTTVAAIDADKKKKAVKADKKKNNQAYQDIFSSKVKEQESNDSWESGGGKDYESGLEEKKLFKFNSKYFQDLN